MAFAVFDFEKVRLYQKYLKNWLYEEKYLNSTDLSICDTFFSFQIFLYQVVSVGNYEEVVSSCDTYILNHEASWF